MDGWRVWFAEHVGLVLTGGAVLAAVALALGVSWAWRLRRRLKQDGQGWLALIGALALGAVGALGLLVTGGGLAAMGPGMVAHRAMLGKPAPPFEYRKLSDDTPAHVADHLGSVVLVNLWATWCPPCIEELPALDRLQQEYRDRGLVVLQVSDEERATLSAFLELHPMGTSHGYVDELPWPEAGRPTTFLVDRQGHVRRVILGSRTFEKFEQLVTGYL